MKGYNTQAKAPDSDSKDKKKKRDNKCNKFWGAPRCKYCNKKHPSEPEDKCAVSFLLNLEAVWQGRSVLFSDEQKLLFEGGKKELLRTPNWILWDVN